MFELEKFIEIKRKKPKLNLHSSYFVIAKELIEKQSSIIKSLFGYNCHVIEDRIYINLPLVDSTLNISQSFSINYDAYKLVSRHLTIDKKFFADTRKKHGLYPAHYSEVYLYKNSDNKSYKIKVHAYLDKNNNFVYIQATKFTDQTEKHTEHLEINELEYTNIFKNGAPANELFGQIIKERNNLLNELVEKSNQLEKELDLLSYRYIFNKKETDFLLLEENSRKFIQLVNKINLYSDEYIDFRGKKVQIILNEFRKIGTKLSSTNKVAKLQEDLVEDNEEFEIITNFQQKSEENEKEKLIIKLKELHKILTSTVNILNSQQDIDMMISKLESLYQARIIILQLEFMQATPNDYSLTEQDQEIIKQMNCICFSPSTNEHIIDSKIVSAILEKFKDFCCKGGIVEVKLLYKHIKHEITFDFLKKTMEGIFSFKNLNLQNINQILILNDQSLKHEQGIVDVINFLQDNVAYYRINLQYIICCSCSSVFEFSLHHCNYKANLFTLFACVLYNKALLFETLINHGADPNGFGLVATHKPDLLNKNSFYALSLIKSCLLFDGIINPFFVKKLFENGALIKHQEVLTSVRRDSFLELGDLKNLSAKKLKSFELNFIKTVPELDYIAHFYSQGTFLEGIKNLDYYLKLLDELFENPYYSNIDLAVYFMCLTSRYFGEKLIIHDGDEFREKFKIIIHNNEEIPIENMKKSKECPHYFNFIYKILPDVACENKNILEKILNKIKLKFSEIIKNSAKLDQLITTTMDRFNKVIIDKDSCSLEQIKNIVDLKMILLKAALLFISFKNEIRKKDLNLIDFIYSKRIEMSLDLLRMITSTEGTTDDRLTNSIRIIINSKKAISEFLIPIDDELENKCSENYDVSQTNFMLEGYKNKGINTIYSCEPPPGSFIRNGKTIVPK